MHFIYVASGERFVKVGITKQPKARAKVISSEFRKRGDAMVKFSVMPGLPAGFGVESSVRNAIALIAKEVHGREWFTGLTHAAVEGLVRPQVMRVRQFQVVNRHSWKGVASAQAKPTPAAEAKEVTHGA